MFRIRDIRLLLNILSGIAVVLALALAYLLWLPAPAPTAPETALPDLRPCTPEAPCVALVIDDVGRDLGALRPMLQWSVPVTFAVLPHAADTPKTVSLLRRLEREFILHLPMDPLDRGKITDESIVLGKDSPLDRALAQCVQQVPGAVGINNHMGSALSQNRASLAQLMPLVRQRGLWLLDSKTIGDSLICQVAQDHAVPCVQRDVFLDDPPKPEHIEQQWKEMTDIARQRGWAVGIAHAKIETLEKLTSLIARSTIRFRRLSALLKGPDAT